MDLLTATFYSPTIGAGTRHIIRGDNAEVLSIDCLNVMLLYVVFRVVY